MPTNDTHEVEDGDSADQRMVLMFVGIGSVAIFFLLFDVVGLINGGGLFSIVSAIEAIRADAGTVDIDESGLLTTFMAILWLIVLCVCFRFKICVGSRAKITKIGFAIVIGSFVLSATLGKMIIASFFQSHGYARCNARDHVVGYGKAQVWFQNYVHPPSGCPPVQPTSTS